MLTFKIPAVKCRNCVEVNWSRYRDTSVTDPALLMYIFFGTNPSLIHVQPVFSFCKYCEVFLGKKTIIYKINCLFLFRLLMQTNI